MKRLIILIFAGVTMVGCNSQPERLVFSSQRNGNSDIYLLNPSTKEVVQLTSDRVEEWSPSWVNQDEICFLRQDLGRVKRFKINVQTGAETPLEQPTNCMLNDKNALFLKNGSQVYACYGHIYLANQHGHVQERLTEGLEGTSNYINLSFDQRYLIFTNNSTGNNDIYQLDMESGEIVNLTNHPANDEHGDLSADGSKLLFSSDRFDDNQEVVLMDMSTGYVTNLSKTPQLELIARWGNKPDSFYYGSTQDGDWELYQFDLNGKKITRLTNSPRFDGDPRLYRSTQD